MTIMLSSNLMLSSLKPAGLHSKWVLQMALRPTKQKGGWASGPMLPVPPLPDTPTLYSQANLSSYSFSLIYLFLQYCDCTQDLRTEQHLLSSLNAEAGSP